MQGDSTIKTLTVAGVLCVVCSVVVSLSVVNLKPQQDANKVLDIKKNLVMAAGLVDGQASTQEILEKFSNVDAKVIDLSTGQIVEGMDPQTYDQKRASKDPKMSVLIPSDLDIAGIKRRELYSKVYFIKKEGQLEQIVLPIYGKGLWSTVYAFLSLAPDAKTVTGIGFYEHGETPGLGGEIENPRWTTLWKGKELFDENFKPNFQVIKGSVNTASAEAKYQVDGLSGATLTSRGVEQLVNYWIGDHGLGKFLVNMRNGSIQI